MSLYDPALRRAFAEDKEYLENTQLPMVSVSATYREDLKGLHGLPNRDSIPDIVYSRAHYSMLLGCAVQAWSDDGDAETRDALAAVPNPEKAWFVDPTNYVSAGDWRTVTFTEKVGKLLARVPALKTLKDLVDRFGRSKLPILDAIDTPLQYLTQQVERPIVSFHIAAGNILAQQGKSVVQVVTDPHVRDEYVAEAGRSHMQYCVFDEQTKAEFLELAQLHGVDVSPDRVIVTGPPVDPRIVACREQKTAWRSGPLRLCITTGGLGTNKGEIAQILRQLLPEIKRQQAHADDRAGAHERTSAYSSTGLPPLQLILFAGVHQDINDMVERLAAEFDVRIGARNDEDAALRLLYHPQIMDANELLIEHAFPWAHGFVTKPSGDMAYDAGAAGCFVLTLAEWGEWEHRVRKVFEQRSIARRARTDSFIEQLQALTSSAQRSQSWVEQAMHHALTLDDLFLKGEEKIIEVARRAAASTKQPDDNSQSSESHRESQRLKQSI
jgi:hypothetical protein